jgi:hypothetical protein
MRTTARSSGRPGSLSSLRSSSERMRLKPSLVDIRPRSRAPHVCIRDAEMSRHKPRDDILQAARQLESLLDPGKLGKFNWFEAIEVIALVKPSSGEKATARNVFSIYVAEPGEPPPFDPSKSSLTEKLMNISRLEGWGFGVMKRVVQPSELIASIRQYGNSGVWQPAGQEVLQVGQLVAAPQAFCPSNPNRAFLNAVLKNNFWGGSYVVELKDQSKTTLAEIAENDKMFEDLSDWLNAMLPIDLSRVPDRLGHVLFQVPAQSLIAQFRSRPNNSLQLNMAWHPEITAREASGEYRVEEDGLVIAMERFSFPEGIGNLSVPTASGELRFSVWDDKEDVLLSATSRRISDGRVSVESYMRTEIEQPRRFKSVGAGKALENHVVQLMEPMEGWRKYKQPRRIQEVDWQARRALKARMKQLVDSRKFVQYGVSRSPPAGEHQRALSDLRQLIRTASKGAIYLWDPYLSANDILNTLAFCKDAGTDLRGLTSSSASKLSSDDDEEGDGSDMESTSAREDWIKAQAEVLDTAFTGPSNMKLEYRVSWGLHRRFHDRFLMFPGLGRSRTRVWSLGASVNHIGFQHCIVQEVDYPEPVLQAFQDFWDESSRVDHLIWKYS